MLLSRPSPRAASWRPRAVTPPATGARRCSGRRSSRASAGCGRTASRSTTCTASTPETPLEESLGAIKEHRDSGKIRHVGLSQVGIDQIERARRVVPIAAVQNHYNLSERRYEDVVDYCTREGIVFVPYYPLRGAGGRALAEIAEQRGATPAQIALAWLLRRSPTMLPIPGTLSLEHLKENLAALEIELSGAEFQVLL